MNDLSWRDKHKDNPAIRQVTVVTATWTDLPNDAYLDCVKLWRDHEYGNDYYYHDYNKEDDVVEHDFDVHYPALFQYLEEHGIEKCLIHYW